MSKAHRTHTSPPQVEPLGLRDEFFYNFNVKESPIEDEDGEPTEVKQYHYDQVKCKLPVSIENINHCLTREGYQNHKVELQDEEFQ